MCVYVCGATVYLHLSGRWIIDYKEIQMGKQVGMGSYGLVYRGRWKGIDVAVKRFIKQKLTERRLLEFRAEMAFLAELSHPNVVLFIGTCPPPSFFGTIVVGAERLRDDKRPQAPA
jgi:hypothetical protein